MEPERRHAPGRARRGSEDGGIPAATPQFQNVTRRACAVVAFASPAIMRKFGGNACTGSSVRRR